MVNTPSSLDDFSTRLQELDELVAPSIFKEEHQEAIRDCVVAHWKRSLVPGLTEVCISSIKQKLGGLLSVAALIDVGFAFRHGIDRQVAWLDLMMDTIGPAVARCCATKEQTTAVLRLIQSEYDRVFDVATF
jgi:hypothetical protein